MDYEIVRGHHGSVYNVCGLLSHLLSCSSQLASTGERERERKRERERERQRERERGGFTSKYRRPFVHVFNGLTIQLKVLNFHFVFTKSYLAIAYSYS